MPGPIVEPSPEAYRSVVRLRTVRSFRPDPVSEEHLAAILEAGRWTGSSKNRQAWAMVVIRDRAQIDRLAGCGQFTRPIRNAPLVVVPVRLANGNDWDMGRLSQNLMLAAAALGVGSCPVTFHREDCARQVLGVPDDHGCRFGIALGYPDEEAEATARAGSPLGGRKPLDRLVSYERFA